MEQLRDPVTGRKARNPLNSKHLGKYNLDMIFNCLCDSEEYNYDDDEEIDSMEAYEMENMV